MFLDRVLCVPTDLQLHIVKEVHERKGHQGREKLWRLLTDRLNFAEKEEAKRLFTRVVRACGPCQVVRTPNFQAEGVWRPTLIPVRLMESVSLDLAATPSIERDEKVLDTLVVCVDRTVG